MKKLLGIVLVLVVEVIVTLAPTPAFADAPTGKLLLVLDASGSMQEPVSGGDSKITIAKTALNQVVASLDPAAQVGMRVYGATVFDKSKPGACTDSQLVVPIGPAGNKKRLTAAIAKYKPYGETPIAYSLRQAGKDLGADGHRTIVLVSDGEETCNDDPCDVAQELADQGIDLRIDVIGLDVSGKARSQLKCVAAKGQGTYTDAKNLDQLKKRLVVAKDRAMRPFEVGGKPVTGATDQLDAPSIGSGRWATKLLGPDATGHYKISRTVDGSTFWVGISADVKLLGADFIGFKVGLATEGGDDCGTAYPIYLGPSESAAGLLTGSLVTRAARRQDECQSGDLILTITQDDRNKVDGAGIPVQLDIFEEPPVTNEADLPPLAEEPTWTAMKLGSSSKIKGGSSFLNAPQLENNGTYTFDIAPGETQVFKVKATWGQIIQTLAGIGTYRRTADSSIPNMDLDILGPYSGDASTSLGRNVPGHQNMIGDGAQGAAITREIRYNNVVSGEITTAAAIDGSYLVTLSYPTTKGQKRPTVPILLKTSVLGTAGTGAPAYASKSMDPPSSTPSPTSSSAPPDSAGPTSSEPAKPAESALPSAKSAPPWGLVGILVGSAALLGAVGVLALRRLRQS